MSLDGLTRAWDEWLAAVADRVWGGVPMLFVLSLVAALVLGLLWAFWPAWLPTRWRWLRGRGAGEGREREPRPGRWRLRFRWRLRWRRRRRGAPVTVEGEPLPDDEVPDLPAEVLALSADELAAAGRYAEAVRERLRAMLRGLIERNLLPASPGWTVMELARAGGRARAGLSAPLDEAARIFSEIWYGLRPATSDDDAAMRVHAASVAAVAAEPEPAALAPAGATAPAVPGRPA